MTTPTPVQPEGENVTVDAIKDEATFLLCRLVEFARVLEDDGVAREFYGHVSPSVARLRALLDAAPPLSESECPIGFARSKDDVDWFSAIPEGGVHIYAAPTVAAAVVGQGVPWDKFPGWLIDHCEGDTITEEGLQRALADMLAASPTPPASEGQEPYYEGGRESVDDAIEVVESFGPEIEGLNDTFARQIILADEVKRLRVLYERAVQGRSDFRSAFRRARAYFLPPLGCPACGILHEEKSCPNDPEIAHPAPQAAQRNSVEAAWKNYQVARGSADHTDKQAFIEVVSCLLLQSTDEVQQERDATIAASFADQAGVSANTFLFDRYVNGVKMAGGIRIEKKATLQSALVSAAKLAEPGPRGEVPVLVYCTPKIDAQPAQDERVTGESNGLDGQKLKADVCAGDHRSDSVFHPACFSVADRNLRAFVMRLDEPDRQAALNCVDALIARAALSTPPMERDALEDPFQPVANWLVNDCGYAAINVSRSLSIGFNRAQRLTDAATASMGGPKE